MPSVIPIRDRQRIPIIRRDLSEDVLEVVSDRFTTDALLEHGLDACASCGHWCEPVATDPDVLCGACIAHEIQLAIREFQGGLGEYPKNLARYIYRRLFVPPGPRPASA